MKKEKLSLKLNKEVIHRLDNAQSNEIHGGKVMFLSIWGSNCNNSDPNKHNCCTGTPVPISSRDSFHCGEMTSCG